MNSPSVVRWNPAGVEAPGAATSTLAGLCTYGRASLVQSCRKIFSKYAAISELNRTTLASRLRETPSPDQFWPPTTATSDIDARRVIRRCQVDIDEKLY